MLPCDGKELIDGSRQTTGTTDRAGPVLGEASSTVAAVGAVPGSVLPAAPFVGPGLRLVEGTVVRHRRFCPAGRRASCGRRSEKLDPDQKMLFDLLEQKIQQQTAEPKPAVVKPAAKPSARNGRVPLPQHLPRERTEYHPPQEALTCPACGQAKERMGEEITEQLDYVPASVKRSSASLVINSWPSFSAVSFFSS